MMKYENELKQKKPKPPKLDNFVSVLLLGAPDYEPLTRGIQAALPHIDNFLPVHNLVSLEGLANQLADLDHR